MELATTKPFQLAISDSSKNALAAFARIWQGANVADESSEHGGENTQIPKMEIKGCFQTTFVNSEIKIKTAATRLPQIAEKNFISRLPEKFLFGWF